MYKIINLIEHKLANCVQPQSEHEVVRQLLRKLSTSRVRQFSGKNLGVLLSSARNSEVWNLRRQRMYKIYCEIFCQNETDVADEHRVHQAQKAFRKFLPLSTIAEFRANRQPMERAMERCFVMTPVTW